MKEGPFEHWT